MDPKKIEAIIKWKDSKNVIGFKLFLKICNYYKRFITKWLDKIEPFTKMTKKMNFKIGTNKSQNCLKISRRRNTKIEIWPIQSYGGPFPSHFDRTVKLRVRISSVTDAAALRRGYRTLLNAQSSTPSEQQSFRGSWRCQDLVNQYKATKSASAPPCGGAWQTAIGVPSGSCQ